ncbi:triacylglycerol lipase [Burkholderia sp. Bp9004]|uniref:esterase/lipase family protein n=1 Tax=Burkholderia sp. Bp9004 TaxID=2184559 RepID=UPI000F5E28C8|nr:alpha/beta hydrolase [Burkholderia sp. Bp9004]RQZ59310.1 alpha/beta hydrolase [Burkholderia sp. Bp9004]
MSENQPDSPGTPGQGSGDDEAEHEVVRLSSHTDEGGDSYAHATLTPADDTRAKETLHDLRPIIPVIFIPGVMGSPIVTKDTGDEAFFAPNMDTVGSMLGGFLSVLFGWFQSASSREIRFDPLKVSVTPLGPINVGDGKTITEEEARRRGWGSVYRTSYQPVLLWLEQQLNNPMLCGELQGAWCAPDPKGKTWALHPVLDTAPTQYGAYGKGEAITSESPEFKRFVKFRYRVYAIGYNWLQSNYDSGSDVVKGVDCPDPQTKGKTRLMGITEICKENDTGKAIIVTHSMGGLVARFAVLSHGAEDSIHGVFHGAQPATGAPLAAKRYKTGGGPEGGMNGFINGSLLGRDANEFIAVMANAPGPMELTPMPDYNNGRAWWIFARPDGTVLMQFPKHGDALSELYLNADWYGLLPKAAQLDPGKVVRKRLGRDGTGDSALVDNYIATMTLVVTRQSQLKNKYHGNTYVAYGNGGLDTRSPTSGSTTEATDKDKPTVEQGELTKNLLAWGNAIWTGDVPADVHESELRAAQLLDDSGKGQLRVLLKERNLSVTFTMQKTNKIPDVSATTDWDRVAGKTGIIRGDGTVPAWSADAQARGLKPGVPGDPANGVQMAFVQAGYEHMKSYAHPWTRWALLYSVVQIVKDIDVPGEA